MFFYIHICIGVNLKLQAKQAPHLNCCCSQICKKLLVNEILYLITNYNTTVLNSYLKTKIKHMQNYNRIINFFNKNSSSTLTTQLSVYTCLYIIHVYSYVFSIIKNIIWLLLLQQTRRTSLAGIFTIKYESPAAIYCTNMYIHIYK